MPELHGPLYYERTGRVGPLLAFLPPNPMDQSCWTYQMQHFSTWFRCMAIDTPGYGRSPSGDDGITYEQISQAFWDAIDEVEPNEKVILAGCSGGFMYCLKMQQMRPERTAAVVLTGSGIVDPAVGKHRHDHYGKLGASFRRRHLHMDFAPAFNATPMAQYFVDLMVERNSLLDVETIRRQMRAIMAPDPNDPVEQRPHASVLASVKAPTLILTGTEDFLHEGAFQMQEQIPGCELVVIPGAGHACQIEQPWLFDDLLIEFLERHGLMKRSEPAR